MLLRKITLQVVINTILIFFVVVTIIESLLLVGLMLSSNQEIKNFIIAATTHKPEQYTELYFENHTKLPLISTPKKPVSFTFTIHNLEYRTVTYPYLVTLKNAGNSATLTVASGSATLPQNQYKSVSQSFTLPKTASRSAVTVTLLNKNQSIFFWIGGNAQ